MRIVKENLNNESGKRIYALPTVSQVALYSAHISNLPNCKHLLKDDPIAVHVKLNILAELLNPANIIQDCFRIVNPLFFELVQN